MAAGHLHHLAEQRLIEQMRITPDHRTLGAFAVRTADRHLEVHVRSQARSPQQAIDIRDDRYIAPVEPHPSLARDEYRPPIDQRPAALEQLDRPGQHRLAMLTGRLQHGNWSGRRR